jgi:hypothetical protein
MRVTGEHDTMRCEAGRFESIAAAVRGGVCWMGGEW